MTERQRQAGTADPMGGGGQARAGARELLQVGPAQPRPQRRDDGFAGAGVGRGGYFLDPDVTQAVKPRCSHYSL